MYSEDAFVARIRNRFFDSRHEVGVGDDAAVVTVPVGRSCVLCSDLLAEDVHFVRKIHPPASIGFKSVAINVSDVSAMGGVPHHFLVSLAVPKDVDEAWVEAFFDGIEEASGRFGVSLVGGDVSRASVIVVDVAMHGSVPSGGAVRRSGARAGDEIYVTGPLGGASLGLERLRDGRPPDASTERHLRPTPPFRVGPEVRNRASAMTDISDGLSTDLTHILTDSGVCARLDAASIPRFEGASESMALHGGEEYELIVVGRDLPREIHGHRLSRIGEIVSGTPPRITLRQEDGDSVIEPGGWRHFSDS